MRERLDVLMVQRGLAQSREKAKTLIKAGSVTVDGAAMTKPGVMCDEDVRIDIQGEVLPFVSRGGLKLLKAVESFGAELDGKVCMDVGASTGGFTDCMLKHGAGRVYSVDVGHDQLAKVLREDCRVICMEGTNIRYLTEADIPEKVDFVSIDVSFISLTKVLGAVKALMKPEACMVCLIKPQFEAGRENVGKNGVVRDRNVHREVIDFVINFARNMGFIVLNLDFSPVKGPEGNIEYLLYLKNYDGSQEDKILDVKKIVEAAHASLS